MWCSREYSILGTKRLILQLWYSCWFGRTSTFLLSNIRLRLSDCSVLSLSKVGDKIINIGSVNLSCLRLWRRQKYLCNLSIPCNYHHNITVTSHSSVCFSCGHGIPSTKLWISHLLSSCLFVCTSIFLLLGHWLSWFYCIILPITCLTKSQELSPILIF